MKQFTRRNSQKQQAQPISKPTTQHQTLISPGKTTTAAAAPPAVDDPYTFVSDEEAGEEVPVIGLKLSTISQAPAAGAALNTHSKAPSSKATTGSGPHQAPAERKQVVSPSKAAARSQQPAAAAVTAVVPSAAAAHGKASLGPPASAAAPAVANSLSTSVKKPAAPAPPAQAQAPGQAQAQAPAVPANIPAGATSNRQQPAGTAAVSAPPRTSSQLAGGGRSGGSISRARSQATATAAGAAAGTNRHRGNNKEGPSTGSGGSIAGGSRQTRVTGVTGVKRGRSSSSEPPSARDTSASQPAAAAVTTPKGAGSGGPVSAAGVAPVVTLPTPHRRSRLVAASLLAAAAAAAGEARPAQTVMEAQERGEQVAMQDDARYAMDGLAPTCGLDTQRDSAVALAEMLSTRKGRTALRVDGLAQQYLTSLAKLKAGKDPVLALAATLTLLSLAAEDANPCYIKSVAAAVLLDQLLQNDYTFDDVAATGAAGAKLCRLIRARPLASVLSSTGVTSTRGLLCIALEQATSTQQASKAAAVEKLKHNLRQHGALARLAALAADTLVAPGGPLAAAKQLHLLLLVLENATFTCPDNGTVLVAYRVVPGSKRSSGSRPSSQQQEMRSSQEQQQQQDGSMSFPAALVSIAQQLQQGLSQGGEAAGAALHVALSVLMNLSHQNPDGGAVISAAGGLEVAAATLLQLLQPAVSAATAAAGVGGGNGQQRGVHAVLCHAVLQHLELLSVALGVLINLVSGSPEHSKELAALAGTTAAAAAAGGGGGGVVDGNAAAAGAGSDGSNSNGGGSSQQQQEHGAAGSSSGSSLVDLLCTVMGAVSQLRQQADTAAGQQQACREGMQGSQSPPPGTAAAAAAAGSGLGGSQYMMLDQDYVHGVMGSPHVGDTNNINHSSRSSSGGLDDSSNTAGEASIVEVYCGMLLGFLVRDCSSSLAQSVAGQLAGGSLLPIIAAVQRCLDFYVTTGAITDHTRTTLEQLLQHLAAAEANLAAAAAGGGGEAAAGDDAGDGGVGGADVGAPVGLSPQHPQGAAAGVLFGSVAGACTTEVMDLG